MAFDGNILVTGAYGLIGHASVLALCARGLEVVATDLLAETPDDADFTAETLDVRGVDALRRVFERRGGAAIVHTAGVSGPMLGRDVPYRVLETNILATLDLFEAARVSGVRRVVLLSSASAYGPTDEGPVREDAPLRATDVYGTSKIAGELIARSYAATLGIEAVVLRPCWVYGPRRRTPCVIRDLIRDALAGRPSAMAFGAGFPRQIVHVDDVARAVTAAVLGIGISGMAFNIADGARRPLDAVADLVRGALPQAGIATATGPDPDDSEIGPLDIASAARALAWTPEIDLPTGIADLVAHLSARSRR